MSYISAIDLSFQIGAKPLFEQMSFHINPSDRIGLVGHNGCGKSTLIRLLAEAETVDSGRLFRQRGLKVGIVEQFLPAEIENSAVIDVIAACLPREERLTEAYRVEALLEQLGFVPELSKRAMNRLSGGEKNLVLFARAIIQNPELLLLDEPGNHMDSKAMFYLKRYLSRAETPAFLMISHDRDLLDSVTDRTLWLRDERCYSFSQPYSLARDALQAQDEAARRTREVEDKEIKQLKTSAKRLANWGKVYDNEDLARKAKSMEKRVEKLEADVTFVSRGSGLKLAVDAELLKSKQLFVFENETIDSPDGKALFGVEELQFRPGDRVALLGLNGVGKSSCIKALLANHRKDSGEQTATRFNPNVRIGYFDQELTQFEASVAITDWIRDHCKASEEAIKRTLINWGFPYAEHQRRVNVLSGGERARLLLLTFQLDQPNLLIMDEPTNHIDLQGKEALEKDLVSEGMSLLFTSHDRRFIETIATRFWWIRGGQLVEIHDPEPFFSTMIADELSGEITTDLQVLDDSTETGRDSDESAVLERICDLERLIEQDMARKPKFQKPKKRLGWQGELAELMQSID
ncbi:MAG: ATP-binding cassette subfamily F protein 3 [Halieaceae bacterium]|jgi:ATP-binding cassette subfamily F protein 3